MIYKFQYHINDDPTPHHRLYTALTEDTATAMFEATCDDGSLSGEHVTLISIKEVAKELPTEDEPQAFISE